MSFKDPERIWITVSRMVDADRPRAANRARINDLFNGNPPFTEAEAQENRIETNVNFLEGTEIIHKARTQCSNAFLKPGKFLTINLDYGPAYKRQEWSDILTKHINRAMKRRPQYYHYLDNKFAGVVLHGIGPGTWTRDRDWCPKAHGVEDVLVPSRTHQDLENLEHFAVRKAMTISDLSKLAKGPGWEESTVNDIIKQLRDKLKDGNSTAVDTTPAIDNIEKFDEDLKENAGFWASDAVPTLIAYDFYYLDTKKKDSKSFWHRKTIIDKQHGIQTTKGDSLLLFDGKDRSYGEDISRLLHVSFADGAVKPPFRWHSTRSLGFLQYALCHLQNRLRCKFSDAVFESMLWYFRNVSAGDEEKLRRVDLQHLGIIPEGLSWVPAGERHEIDFELLAGALSMNKQMIGERASSYTQDSDNGTQREETATAVMARVNEASSMVGGMLTRLYTYQQYEQIEIVRRFATIDHEDCKEFRKCCMRDGVPEEVFKEPKAWEVIIERVMGNGNKTLEIAQANQLMAIKDTAEVSPDARRVIVNRYITANTDDPQLASLLVPVAQPGPSESVELATLSWGTLIAGQQVLLSGEINKVEIIGTLLGMLAKEIQRINATGGAPDIKEIMGLANVVQTIQANIQQIQADKGIADMVRGFSDALGQASNEIKGYFQRFQEAQQEQGQQQDPEVAAKVQAMLITAQAKGRIAELTSAQKREHKEKTFVQAEARKDRQLESDIARKGVTTQADVQVKGVNTLAELKAKALKTQADVAATDVKTRADIVRENVVAANEPKEPVAAP